MDPKGYEKKPWFPYVKNMYDEIKGDMMEVDAKGYEEKPWWPYVLDLQQKIDEGGGGGSVPSDFYKAEVTVTNNTSSSIFTVVPSTLESNQDVIAIKWGSNGITYPENTGFYNYDANTETTDTYYIYNECYIAGFSESITGKGFYTVTGNAEVLTFEGMPMIKITGDCIITIEDPNT